MTRECGLGVVSLSDNRFVIGLNHNPGGEECHLPVRIAKRRKGCPFPLYPGCCSATHVVGGDTFRRPEVTPSHNRCADLVEGVPPIRSAMCGEDTLE
jgi:hypothetical protein